MRGAASRLAAAVTAVAVMAAVGATAPQAADVPATPAGTTALALDGKVSLAWKAAADADGYAVYRGTSPAAVTTKISPAQLTATTFEDTTAVNGVTYFYAVRAEAQEGESPSSQ